ncbi:MAG: high-affinity branched-chain amino acid transporter, ATP-binding protein [Pseudomonadota bacterium]|jgi:branched-chain amino acid transport system ATP-binding protein|nr:ABC transporter ATP-binding protein [Burkholderiales bacterium]
MTKLLIQNLSKQFAALVALDNISLELETNKIYGLIGPNGSGKTTLFNCISGVYKPSSGNITFAHHSIINMAPEKIAQLGIRRTFQTIRLSSELTVAENIYAGYHHYSKHNFIQALFNLKGYRQDEIHCWREVHRAAKLLDIEPHLRLKVKTLAYGIQRKVEIARAIISQPQLLVLDEPAAGMNESEKIELTHIIKQIQLQNITILIIEHDMHMISTLCDTVFVLNHGKLIASGSPTEILNNKQVISAYMGDEHA